MLRNEYRFEVWLFIVLVIVKLFILLVELDVEFFISFVFVMKKINRGVVYFGDEFYIILGYITVCF